MKHKLLLALCFLGFGLTPCAAQQFGKNHVQYRNFKTYYLQSQHFDIYFTEGGRPLAEFVAATAERAYRELRSQFRYELTARITFIIYNSHNDFEQTNVLRAPLDEAIGGFTEYFKNRIVLPFNGEWERFRHVIHHELTHAVLLQMFYGPGIQSIIFGINQFQLPLWFMEGLAEYESLGWDIESDMFLRDAAVGAYLPPLSRMQAFLAYKGGQSVFYFIAETYGRARIGDLLHAIRGARNLDYALRNTLGVDLQTLDDRWHRFVKKRYWPEIAGRSETPEIARPLTRHLADRSLINNSPALSPDGSTLAFLTDRSEYFDIHLLDLSAEKPSRKLVSGQKSGALEELHWLRPGIAWSPDGRQLAFAAKAGAADALHIVDAGSGRILRSFTPALDGIFSPAWSPDGELIAFVGIKKGQSDIYLLHVAAGTISQITNDVFSDLDPAFSPDGRQVAFVSDRGAFTDSRTVPADFKIQSFDYQNHDIYLAALRPDGSAEIRRITHTPSWEKSPVFAACGTQIYYISDRSGIYNIYRQDLQDGQTTVLTNLLSGATQLSLSQDGTKLAFVSFQNGGYDIFLLEPLRLAAPISSPRPTRFFADLADRRVVRKLAAKSISVRSDKVESRLWESLYGTSGRAAAAGSRIAFLDNVEYISRDGRFKIHDYKAKFSPDLAFASAGYSQLWGVQGGGLLALSDLLGNHRLEFYTDFYYNFKSSDFVLRYFYLPRRIDVGFGAFHQAFFFRSHRFGIMRDRYFGANLYFAYPLNRFQRYEGRLVWLGINREFFDIPALKSRKLRIFMLSAAYVKDTSLWGGTGPVNGTRSELRVNFSPGYNRRTGLEFLTLRGDYRKYTRLGRDVTLASRIAAGASGGKNPQHFFLGGVDNWINSSYNNEFPVDRPELIYFSSFEFPLRGASFYESTGSRFFLANFELRFPLLRYFALRWPLAIGFTHLRGVLFTDIGAAWERRNGTERFRPLTTSPNGLPRLRDMKMGYGVGARANLGFFVLRFDTAWSTDLYTSAKKPRYYFSLGAEF